MSVPDSGGKSKCKILLIFSRDGVDAADEFVRIANTVDHSVSSQKLAKNWEQVTTIDNLGVGLGELCLLDGFFWIFSPNSFGIF